MIRTNVISWIETIVEFLQGDVWSQFIGWILLAMFAGVVVPDVVKWINKGYDYFKGQIPRLDQLVLQAHRNGPVETMYGIKVSPEMRDALCLPLTPQQLETMRVAGEDVYRRSVFCYLVSSRFKGGALSGVVHVSVTVHSKYSKNDLVYPDAELRIVVRHNGRRYPMEAWEVVSVEKVA